MVRNNSAINESSIDHQRQIIHDEISGILFEFRRIFAGLLL